MSSSVNPYHDWLGVPPQVHPVDHYRLLGVGLFESNPQAIVDGYQRQTERLSPHSLGPDADAARRLLGELAAAQACLLNPTTKEEYDGQLRTQLSPATPSATVAATPPPSQVDDGQLKRPKPRWRDDDTPGKLAAIGTTASAAGASPSESGDPPATPGTGEQQANSAALLPWMLGGAGVGLAAVLLVGLIVFTWRAQHRAEAKKQNDVPSVLTMHDDDSDGPKKPKPSLVFTNNDPDGEKVAPSNRDPDDLGTFSTKPDEPEDNDPPEDNNPPMTTVKPPPPRGDPVAGLASVVDLPWAISGGTVSTSTLTLGPVELLEDDEVEVTIVGDEDASPGSPAYEIVAAEGDDRRWQVRQTTDGGSAATIAEYEIDNGEMQFRWLDGAAATGADHLRNHFLQVAVADHSRLLPLRKPLPMTPLVMKFDGGVVDSSVNIDAVPTGKKLRLVVEPLSDDFPTHKFDGESTVVEGDSTDIWFGKEGDALRLALRVSLNKIGTRRFKVEARPMMNVAGSGRKLDYFRPAAAARELATLKQQQIAVQTQIDDLRRRLRRQPTQLQQATAALNAQLTQLQTRIATLEEISTMCQSLHGQAEIGFRLFTTVGEHELDLAKSMPEADADDDAAS